MNKRKLLIFLLSISVIILSSYAFGQVQDERIRKAQIYIQSGDFQEAANILQKMIKQDPTDPDANYLLGIAYFGMKELDKAESQFGKCINLSPQFEEAYLQLTAVQAEKKEYEKAEKTINQLLIKKPDSALAYYAKGVLYYMQQKVKQAIESLNQAIIKDKKLTYAYANLGIIYYNEKKYDEAMANFGQASLLDDSNPEFVFAQGWTERKRGKTTESYRYFNKASEMNPPHVYSITVKAIKAYDEKDYPKASDALKELSNLKADFEKGMLLQAQIFIQEKKFKEAEPIIKKLLEMNPLDADAKDEMEILKPHLEKMESEEKEREKPETKSTN